MRKKVNIKVKLILPISLIIILVSGSVSATNPIGLGANIQSQSPDGSIIEVSGGITSEKGNIIGWIYDWGDGIKTTNYFSTFHRYKTPGSYTISITGYDDQGNNKTVLLSHNFPEKSSTSVSTIELSDYSLGLKCGETANVAIIAYNKYGNTLSINERNIEIYNPFSDVVSTQIQNSTLKITANFLSSDFRRAYIWVYIDKIEAVKPLKIIVNKNSGDFYSLYGDYFGLYLPVEFFERSQVTNDDFIRILDLGFALDIWTVRKKWDGLPLFQGVSYAPTVYGVSGNPLGLGDHALPQDGIPSIGVIFHEMGHNFHGINLFFNSIGVPGPFYQETLAEWFAQYNLHKILIENSSEFGPEAIQALVNQRDEGISMHDDEYQEYINNGMLFNYDDILSSQALVKKIFDYCYIYGWERIQAFFDHFDMSYIPTFSNIIKDYGGFTVENKVTFMIAIISSTFWIDVKSDFQNLNFPINNPLYNRLLTLFSTPPTITSIEPQQGYFGESFNFVINGTNLIGTTMVNFSSGIKVNTFNVDSANQVTANIIIDNNMSESNVITVSTPGGTDHFNINFTIDKEYNQTQIANFYYMPSEPNVDVILNFTDESNDINGNIVNWTWDLDDGTIKYGKQIYHIYKDEGNYNVTLTIVNDQGQTDHISRTIAVTKISLNEKPQSQTPGFEMIIILFSIIIFLLLKRTNFTK